MVKSPLAQRMMSRSTIAALVAMALLAAACTSSDEGSTPESTTPSTAPATSVPATAVTSPPSSETTPGSIALAGPWEDYEFGSNNERVLWGMAVGGKDDERRDRFTYFEAQSGENIPVGHSFHPWADPIPNAEDLFHLASDRLLLLSWNGTDTKEIASGGHDDWIRQQARAVDSLEQRILLRWMWEMDGKRRDSYVHSGADYIAAWNHIRAIFDEEGVDNAEFVWCPNEFLFDDERDPNDWYPGDENVDWLCADGYNWATSTDDSAWKSFEEIFTNFYAWAEPKGLPIIIAETGSGEDGGGGKAAWLASAQDTLETTFPAVDIVVYFDLNAEPRGHRDWRLDTSPETEQAWLEVLGDPYASSG